VENVKLLGDPKSGVQIALVLGGVLDGKRAPELLSLGTVYNNPFWLFYSSNELFDRLSQFKGKRIAAGPVGSGTRSSAEQILGKAGVNSENTAFLPIAGSAAVEALGDGKVDAVWVLGAPDGVAVHFLTAQSQRPAHALSNGGGLHNYIPRNRSVGTAARCH
jgi:TRAP-type uncharacterized transport system substrate-binding protein